ncbi:MAG: hypothetical protein Q4C33_01705 [bacterium]|nr:hypothetical protein [bacterium]
MVEFTLLEKIRTIFNLIFSSPLFLVLLFGLVLILVDIKFISKKDKKTKAIYSVVSLLVIGILISMYYDSLLVLFNTISKNLISLIYFPTVLEYIIMLIISLIILICSLVNKKISANVKTFNALAFISNSYIFFLILDEIENSKVDLSSKISIYTNDHLMILFEVSLGIFIFWIVSLILIKIIKTLAKPKKEENFYEEPELPKTIEEVQREIVYEPKVEYVVVEKKNENDMFTLDEYRQMRAILEVIKENQKKA